MQKYFSRNYAIPSRNRVKTKKKNRSSPQFGSTFDWNLWDLFVLTGPFLSNHLALKPRWGTLNRNGGTLNLDGGTRPSYNLSTDYTIMFATGMFSWWIWSRSIIPVPKTLVPKELGEFRPITLLNLFSKVFEKVLKTKIRCFTGKYNVLSLSNVDLQQTAPRN